MRKGLAAGLLLFAAAASAREGRRPDGGEDPPLLPESTQVELQVHDDVDADDPLVAPIREAVTGVGLADTLGRIRDRLGITLAPETRIHVVCTGTRHGTKTAYTSGSGGWIETGFVIPRCREMRFDPDRMRESLLHEMVHVIHRSRMRNGYVRTPKWLKEGMAVYCADQLDDYLHEILRRRRSGDTRLAGPGEAPIQRRDVYALGYFFFEHLEAEHGVDGVHAFMQTLVNDHVPHEEGLVAVTGGTWEAFVEDWLAHARARIDELARG